MWFNINVPPNPLLTVNETIVEEAPPEVQRVLTWRDNPNNCNEDIEWIAEEEPFYCILKPVPAPSRVNTQVTTQNTSKTIVRASSAPSGWYPYGECTWWVWTKRTVGQWNNATDWLWQAERDGYATGTHARAGAIAWRYGHVAFTEQVKGDMILVSEANYDRKGSIRTIWVHKSEYTHYIY